MIHENTSVQYMTKDDLKKKCPLAFAQAPTNHVSDKYVLANTATVIDDMEKLGWLPVLASQRKARKGASGRFSYHMIVFQNPDVKIVNKNDDGSETVDSYPRIILTNSHDGLAAFRFRVGIYRCICENGLVIPSSELTDVKVRHINYTFEGLRQIICKAVEVLPGQVEIMNTMKTVELNDEQRLDMAKKMLAIREEKPVEEVTVEKATLEDMLTPMREADNGKDLWTTFNILQEKVIRGGFMRESQRQNSKTKYRKVRRVASFIKDLDYNERMFATALEYVPVEAA